MRAQELLILKAGYTIHSYNLWLSISLSFLSLEVWFMGRGAIFFIFIIQFVYLFFIYFY